MEKKKRKFIKQRIGNIALYREFQNQGRTKRYLRKKILIMNG